MNYPEARIGLCKCKEGSKVFGIRFEEYEKDWKATWAFALKKQDSAKRENYDKTVLKGNIIFDDAYPGCPFCKGYGMVICEACGGLNCRTSGGKFVCGWCGNDGELVDYTGDGFSAGTDR